MATTVNTAFSEFLKDTVNLDSTDTKTARASRDNLLDNIKSFSGDDDFFYKIFKDNDEDNAHRAALRD